MLHRVEPQVARHVWVTAALISVLVVVLSSSVAGRAEKSGDHVQQPMDALEPGKGAEQANAGYDGESRQHATATGTGTARGETAQFAAEYAEARYVQLAASLQGGGQPWTAAKLNLWPLTGPITSPFGPAAHHGHVEVVRELLRTAVPVNQVNNLGWTALLETVILGDGGPAHLEIARALLDAGADVNLADRAKVTPLAHARMRGHLAIAALLERAGGR